MPYVPKESRARLDEHVNRLVQEIADRDVDPGEMNYVVYAFLLRIFKMYPRYRTINIIDGVLKDVAAELYRRHFGPYEDKAIERNGDIE
jgi:hypothetical protein